MKQTNKDPQLDDKLTDFTDRVLAGKSARPDSTADEELQRLEQTIIRLKRVIHQTESDTATLRQIESRIMARLRLEVKSTAIPFLRKRSGWNWKYGRSRLQMAGLALLLVIVLVLVSTFMIPSGGSAVPATVFASNRVVLMAIALTGLFLTLIWIRRK